MKSFFNLTILALVLVACQPAEEFISEDASLRLKVSTDTVLFDTLLTDRGSITGRFKIYNPNKSAIKLDDIRLGSGTSSAYSLIINGREAASLQNEVLFGKDSLQVLVSVFIDPQDENTPYLVKDSVVFEWNGNSAHVKLVAYGQDAIYVNRETLCDVNWTSDRPYVLMDTVVVLPDCFLNIEAGAQIFLDNNAALFVQGTLRVMGEAGSRVTIKNTRFDQKYKQAPGQWDGIYFLPGSTANEIHYADITNGGVGLYVGTPDDDENFDLTITNTTIGFMSQAGILAFTSEVIATNTLVYNCGQYLVGNFAGGRYQYDHCTLVNFPSSFVRSEPSVQFSDNVSLDGETFSGDLNITLRNTIIWGTQSDELLIAEGGFGVVTKQFQTGIVRSTLPVSSHYISQEINFPGFINSSTFDYQLDEEAFARNRGTQIGVLNDLDGQIRDVQPDIGAFEWIDED